MNYFIYWGQSCRIKTNGRFGCSKPIFAHFSKWARESGPQIFFGDSLIHPLHCCTIGFYGGLFVVNIGLKLNCEYVYHIDNFASFRNLAYSTGWGSKNLKIRKPLETSPYIISGAILREEALITL